MTTRSLTLPLLLCLLFAPACDDRSGPDPDSPVAGGKADETATDVCLAQETEDAVLACLIQANDARLAPDDSLFDLSLDAYREQASRPWCDATAGSGTSPGACKVEAELFLSDILAQYIDEADPPTIGEFDARVDSCVDAGDVIECVTELFAQTLPEADAGLAERAQDMLIGSHLTCVAIVSPALEARDVEASDIEQELVRCDTRLVLGFVARL